MKRFVLLPILLGFFTALLNPIQAQVVVGLDYYAKEGTLASIPSGQYWTMKLRYTISSTTGSASGVKIVVNIPDYIYDTSAFVGTVHAPASNFVFSNTPGAKKLTINFVDPVVSGANGILEFAMRTTNGATLDGSVVHTCAEMTATGGATSGQKCHDMPITAVPNMCSTKTVQGAVALDYEATYKVSLMTWPTWLPTDRGLLNQTNISVTDTYPAGAELVSATVYGDYGTIYPAVFSYGPNSVTMTFPDITIHQRGDGWEGTGYYAIIKVKYKSSSGFTVGQNVTNQAAITFTPYGGTPITVVNGQNLGGCDNDLIETHTLEAPNVTATIEKTSNGTRSIHSNEATEYGIRFTNNGNVPLENVEIVETVPSQLIAANVGVYGPYFSLKDQIYTADIEYQTNLNSTWTSFLRPNNWEQILPTLPTGEYFTKIRYRLTSPFPPGAKFEANLNFLGSETITSQLINNCLEWNSTTVGIPANRTACNSSYTLVPTSPDAKIRFGLQLLTNCTEQLGNTATFKGWVQSYTGYSGLQSPMLAMLVDEGFEYVTGSEVFYPLTSGITTTPTLTIVPNFDGTHRSLYRWTFPPGTVMASGTRFELAASFKIGPKVAPIPVNHGGTVAMWVSGNNVGLSNTDNSSTITDTYDWNLNGNITETFPQGTIGGTNCNGWYQVTASAAMESIKWVKGLLDADYSRYPASGRTVPGGNADYKLIVTNKGNVTMKDIKIVDILPFIRDKGVIDLSNRNTEWTPNLADPITAPPGITIYYSTSENPCRDEMKGAGDPSPFPTGCEAPNWSTTTPVNITTVKSVKIDFGATTLAGGDELLFSWPMRAPTNAPTNNEIAWNSFGFVATRTDNNEVLLAAEPIKVGIQVEPGAPAYYGNRVWYDADHDGIQDAQEGGVDGVKARLFKVPTLGSARNPATDQQINFTITGNGGYYKFSNLAAGFYYAVFELPTGYSISPRNTGTTINDSDGETATYGGKTATITAVTELVATEDDDSWDQGIYCNFSPVITTNSPIPVGGTLTMSVNPTTGAYAWAGPGGWTATGSSVTRINMSTAEAGTYSVNVYELPDGSGCWASLNTEVVVGNVCSSLSVTATPGACSSATNTYNVTGQFTFANAPTSGTLSATIGASSSTPITMTGTTTSPQSYTITGLTADGASHTVSASFSASPTCTGSINYNAPSSCTVTGQPDLQLIKTASTSTVSAGQTYAYTLALSNTGTATATGVQVRDLIPTGLTYVSSTASQGSYNQTTGIWTVGTVAVGASLTLTITVTVN